MARQIGLGCTVGFDAADGTMFTTITLITEIQPSNREREEVDGTVLADTLATNEIGIEAHSHFSFMQYWHPNATADHELMDTALGNKVQGKFRITYAFATPVTDTFSGKVVKLEPAAIVRDGVIGRRVTVHRTTAITRA